MLLDPNPATASLRVTLPGLQNGVIPQENAFGGMGCTGQNRSPRIQWSGAPAGTRSFAIIAHDPDAPTGVGFFHWIVANLPAHTTELAAGAAMPPGAIQTQTDFGQPGYGGPCPPPGETHRYIFTVYALDVPHLDLPATASGALTRFMLRGHTLALGRAIGTYRRP
jgi:Raf kinase inhibitor-like YbhB/YbcL family protein